MKHFVECFSDLPDPRADNALHDLTEILFVALLATLCGAKSCCDIALFARTKATKGVVALDGKALRRAYERGKSHMPPVMVTAWSAQTRMALANTLAPGNNEAAAALQLIDLLSLKGCVVTADALHCHRKMAKAIVKRGGDYVLAVKNNQPGLPRIVRQHWTIENGLHWPLDVILDEDLARSRKDNAPANLAVLRRLALNIAHAHPDTKTSLRGKLKRAGWDETFLFEMLRHMR